MHKLVVLLTNCNAGIPAYRKNRKRQLEAKSCLFFRMKGPKIAIDKFGLFSIFWLFLSNCLAPSMREGLSTLTETSSRFSQRQQLINSYTRDILFIYFK